MYEQLRIVNIPWDNFNKVNLHFLMLSTCEHLTCPRRMTNIAKDGLGLNACWTSTMKWTIISPPKSIRVKRSCSHVDNINFQEASWRGSIHEPALNNWKYPYWTGLCQTHARKNYHETLHPLPQQVCIHPSLQRWYDGSKDGRKSNIPAYDDSLWRQTGQGRIHGSLYNRNLWVQFVLLWYSVLANCLKR